MAEVSTQPRPILHGVIEIVSAHLAHNAVSVSEVPAFIRSVHSTLAELEGEECGRASKVNPIQGQANDFEAPRPAVPVDQSVTDDYLVCLEDGKRLRMLKRYLATQFGMTPEEYRAKWGLPADYPMAARTVTEQRRGQAISRGFGKRSEKAGSGRGTPKK